MPIQPTLTNLPGCIEEQLCANVATILTTDPTLAAQGVTFRLLDGDPSEDDDPAIDEMPCVRLSIGSYPSARLAERQHAGHLTLNLDGYHAGRHRADTFRLANALVKAFLPSDPTRGTVVRSLMMDSTYTDGHLKNVEFRAEGGAPVTQGVTRYGTRVRVAMVLSINKST